VKTYPIDLAVVFTLLACFLRATKRFKDGKEHRYWSSVENRRCRGNRIVQRQVLYLGEINDVPHHGWCKTIEVLEEDQRQAYQVALFPEDRPAPDLDHATVQVKLCELQLHRPRQWGACWLAYELWDQLALDAFWSEDRSGSAPRNRSLRPVLQAHSGIGSSCWHKRASSSRS
jgi:hypothetical protein